MILILLHFNSSQISHWLSLSGFIAQLESPADTQLTLDGRGDPLLFEDLEAVIAMAVAAGVGGIHVCTDLLDPPGASQAATRS